jgi:signal transduction histidine kinase
MAIAPSVQNSQSTNTRLVVSRVLVLLSALLVIFFVVCVVISASELLKQPEQFLPEPWTQAHVETFFSPFGIPTSWLVWYRLFLEIGFAVTAIAIAASIFIYQPKSLFSYFVAFWLVLHGAFSGVFAETVAWLHPTLAPFTKGLLMLGWWGLFLLTYVFPTGKFIPRWTIVSIPCFFAAFVFLYPSYALGIGVSSPVISGLLLVLAFAGVLAQGYRFVKVSTPVERQQAKWILFAIAARVVYLIVISIPTVREQVTSVTWQGLITQVLMGVVSYSIAAFLPVAVGIAILRYHLWDLDPILNRTFVYGGLTLFIIVSYALIVGGIGSLLGSEGISPLLSVFAAGLVAVTFQPLRERLQRTVNRLIYGMRDEPYQVLTQLAQRLEVTVEPTMALPLTVETIAHALKLPYVAISLKQDGIEQIVAAYGVKQNWSEYFLITYAGETIGELIAVARTGEVAFNPADLRLLSDLASQIGATAHAVLVSADLERARLRIVETREETRRRLGSDLHDVVGHQLAGLVRQSERAANLLEQDKAATWELLADIKTQLDRTIIQVRQLAHQLYPPELELLGLVGALRERIQANDDPSLIVRTELPETLPKLPTAVEAAAYYIALEALTNVSRHAGARSCNLRLEVKGQNGNDQSQMLELEICDDGRGLSPTSAGGLGMLSMQGRAAEVGGLCTIEANPGGGTRVIVRLPFRVRER